MSVMELELQENVSPTAGLYPLHGDRMASAPRRRIPLFVARDQLYYWTNAWQAGERQALADVEAGRYRIFPDGASAAQWLLSDEDD